jgi:hypothetical protein
LRRNGFKNKILLLILSIPAIAYAVLEIYGNYDYFDLVELYYYSFGLLVLITVIIFSTNTLSFIKSQRSVNFKVKFKRDFFECIHIQIPEIKKHFYNQKIHPKYFYASDLFKSVHTDYIGDDLFYGEYYGYVFEICELHVFKVFKQIFDGLFIRIIGISSSIDDDNYKTSIIPRLNSLEEKYKIKYTISAKNQFYIAIRKRGKLFENNNIREIKELEVDIELLNDVVTLTKGIINCCQHRV